MDVNWEFFIGTAIRWAHVLTGIVWVGSLYYLTLVQRPALARLDPPARRQALLALMPRALGWLRWGAMATLVLGIVLFTWIYHRVGNGFGVSDALKTSEGLTDRALFSMIGITLALVLWFVVWFLLGPTWRRILAALEKNEAEPQALLAHASRLASFNALLSGPMLLFMVAPQHYNADVTGAVVALFFIVGAGVVWLLLGIGSGKGG